MSERDLSQLAKTISARVDDVMRLLKARGIDAEDAQRDGYPAGSGFEELASARFELLKAANDLQLLALGRTEWLKVNLAVTKYDHLCYYMIDQFKIHQCVPLNEEITYEDLSKTCGLPLDPLKRILRHAMLNNLFYEPKPGYVAHSKLSSVFITDPKMSSWLGHNYDEVFRCFIAVPEVVKKYPNASDPGQTACGLTFNQPKGLFGGLFHEYPWRAARFEGAMHALTQGSYDPSYLVHGYDWGKHEEALVVDVGGSSGYQSVAIAQSFPNLRFIVQDIEDHSSKLEEHKAKAGVLSEIQFQVHDFLKTNPQKSADIYILRHIIHDWADENASKILQNIATVMKPGARIIIMDIVAPEPGTLPWQEHRMISFMDLQMMVMINGKERSKQEWSDLVSMAHPKLKIVNINQPPRSVASAIEVAIVDES